MNATFVEIVQHLRPGGIERLALDLALDPPTGDRGLLVSLEGDAERCLAAWPALHGHADRLVFMNKQPGLDAALPFRLARLLRRRNARWVHSHHLGPLLYGGLAARLRAGTIWVHTEHDAWHFDDAAQAAMTRRCMRLLRPRTTAVAGAVADGMEAATGARRATVVRNGIDTLRFAPGDRAQARQRLGLPGDAPIVGIGGRLEAEKNHALAIAALAREPAGKTMLVLAGSGSLRARLEGQAQDLGVAGRVSFLGHVEDMPLFYRALDVFCLPSRSEGLPLSLLEAQACGIPAVATDVGGCREAVCPASGAVVPGEDAAALAAAWSRLLARNSNEGPRNFVLANGSVAVMRDAYRRILA